MDTTKLKSLYLNLERKKDKIQNRLMLLSLLLIPSTVIGVVVAFLTDISMVEGSLSSVSYLLTFLMICCFGLQAYISANRENDNFINKLKIKDKNYQEELTHLETQINSFKSEITQNIITNAYINPLKFYQVLQLLLLNSNNKLLSDNIANTLKEMVEFYHNHIRSSDITDLIEVTLYKQSQEKIYFKEEDLITAFKNGLLSLNDLAHNVIKIEDTQAFEKNIKHALTHENLNQLLNQKENDKSYSSEQVSHFFMKIRGISISQDNAQRIKDILGEINYFMFMKHNTIEDLITIVNDKSIITEIDTLIQNLNVKIDLMNPQQQVAYKATLEDLEKAGQLNVLHDSDIVNTLKERLLTVQEELNSEQYNNIIKFKRYLMKTA